MNDIKNDTAYAYRSYHSLQNYVRMTLRMHLGILRTLFATQLAIVCILFLITMTSPVSPWHLELTTFGSLLPVTFLVYLLHPFIVMNFRRRSRREFTERTRRGTSQVSEAELKKVLPTPWRIPLSEQLHLPVRYETQHVFCAGASGTGKTVFLSQAIAAVRSLPVKGIIHGGKDGELAARFFNPQTDLIFNPFDKRSISWNVFDCIRDDSDFDGQPASFLKMPPVSSSSPMPPGIFSPESCATARRTISGRMPLSGNAYSAQPMTSIKCSYPSIMRPPLTLSQPLHRRNPASQP